MALLTRCFVEKAGKNLPYGSNVETLVHDSVARGSVVRATLRRTPLLLLLRAIYISIL